MCSGVNGVSGVESEVNTYFSRQSNWASIPKVVGSTPAVVRHIYQLARCSYRFTQNRFTQNTQH